MAILVAQPVPGSLACTMRQIGREFHLFAHLAALKPHPELLAASWALLHESILTSVDRVEAERIAAFVSKANQCGYLTALHASILAGLGEFRTACALLTGRPGEILEQPYRKADRNERNAILTAHFFSRLAIVLGPNRISLAELWLAYRAACKQVLPHRNGSPGTTPASAMDWVRAVGERLGEESLTEAVRLRVVSHIRSWDGERRAPNRSWVENHLADFSPPDRAAARLAMLVAMAPHQIDSIVVESFCHAVPDPAVLVAVVGWASTRALDRLVCLYA